MRALLLVSVVLALPACSFGQTADSVLRAAQARSWGVRVSSGANILAEGSILGFSRDTVIFRSARVPVSAITEVDKRTRSGGGAWTGAGLGALLVGGLFGVMAAGFCEYECSDDFVIAAGFGVATGGTIGALLGEAIHPAKRGWQHIWQRPERP